MKSNYQVCKDFAENKSATRSTNVFFAHDWNGNGRTLYSYGYHFAIARIIDGQCFFTVRGYSRSTTKHIADARRAPSGVNLVFCPYPESVADSLKYWSNALENLRRKLSRARKPEKYTVQINSILQQMKIYLNAVQTIAPAWMRLYTKMAKNA